MYFFKFDGSPHIQILSSGFIKVKILIEIITLINVEYVYFMKSHHSRFVINKNHSTYTQRSNKMHTALDKTVWITFFDRELKCNILKERNAIDVATCFLVFIIYILAFVCISITQWNYFCAIIYHLLYREFISELNYVRALFADTRKCQNNMNNMTLLRIDRLYFLY